jgi:hypothetical protein
MGWEYVCKSVCNLIETSQPTEVVLDSLSVFPSPPPLCVHHTLSILFSLGCLSGRHGSPCPIVCGGFVTHG